ncbi:hypothetical protein CDD82_3013 [Ophiocordyceps australis]|uniref:N-acetyltransferase domain-containing protein n=1 Tax=Ophiocordyceps australis TaxID=1399860 RepID=A0A2C5ZGE3_9HYPO|nr:hypothetical protein CDD82_3013 [Ophiocordyceps australis]
MAPATSQDVPALASLLFEDFMEQDAWTKLCFGDMDPPDRLTYYIAGLREDIENPEYPMVVQKMQDDATGEAVAFTEIKDGNVAPLERDFVEPMVKPKGYNVGPIRENHGKMVAALKRAMGEEKPFLYLVDMTTKKSHRRRGIATTLMQWAMEMATRRQLPIYCEASADGHGLYKHLGWEVVESWSVDMGQYGGEGIYTEWGMRWTPPLGQAEA